MVNSRAAKPSPIVVALSNTTCCRETDTSSRASNQSLPTPKSVSTSRPTASCNCLSRGFKVNRRIHCGSKEEHVHTEQSGRRPGHDDYQRHLLGFVGEHLQGRKRI